MTVLFADLVDSTALSTGIDLEDYRELIADWMNALEAVVHRYDGHVGGYRGDGLLVYFGYPRAHEEDSRRACAAALDMVQAVRGLCFQVAGRTVPLSVRIGIHTGPTALSPVGEGSAREMMAVGEAVNLAARLQTLAGPDTVVISAATELLIRRHFSTRPLDPHRLRGFQDTVEAHQLIAGDEAGTHPADTVTDTDPLVGRELELATLTRRWAEAAGGTGRVVVMTGEAGLGKTRLVAALHAHLRPEHTWLHTRGSPLRADTPLRPILDAFPAVLAAGGARTRTHLAACLAALGPGCAETSGLLGALLAGDPPETSPAGRASPQLLRRRTLEALVEVIAAMAHRSPLAMVWEDVHWLDDTSLELIDRLSEAAHAAPLLLLVTGRPGFDPPLIVDTELTLRPLPADQVGELARHIAGGALPEHLIAGIARRAEGNPLYVEELTRSLLGERPGGPNRADGEAGAIPATLHELLLARLDRAAGERTVIQCAATVGRNFGYRLLREVLAVDDERLQRELAEHVAARLLNQRGTPPESSYAFHHVLLRDAAYESMTRRARMDFHRRIASCMQATPPAPEPEILAHHLAGAGDVLVAARAWNTAGQAALAAFALTEAVNHVRRGLDCLKSATGPEAAAAETELRTTLGVPLMLREGFASAAAGENYRRLLEVCEQAGSAAEHAMLPALYGMWTFHEVGGRLQQAQQMGRRLLDLGERLSDTGVLLAGHIAHGAARLLRGDIPAARRHLETGLALHDPPVHAGLARLFGQDGAAMCAGFLTWVAAHQDDPEAGRHRAAQALAIARTSLDPGTAGFVEAVVATYHCLTGDHLQAETHALAVIALGEEQGMPHWSAQGRCNLGWALAGQGALQTGAKHLRAGLDGLRATGTRAATSYFQAALVQTELRLGNPDEATRLLAAAHVLVADTDERFNEPELLRLHGEITLARGGPQARALADEAFTQAVQLARLQGSAASARRAAAHLARGATP